MSATSQNPNQGAGYDAAGDVTNDGVTQYLYDGEGRVCAVASTPVAGFTSYTGYVYDADGNRVAKGTLTQFTCDLNPADSTYNGLMTAGNETDYILGIGGEQVSEVAEDANGSMNWQRTYVYAAGMLFATYDPTADSPNQPLPSFRLTDWLGTMRATTDSFGVAQGTCNGLPFGDPKNPCQGNIPDNRFFTGKERDTETGLDYFGARYYASTMGRFMSPDWSAKAEPVPYAKLDDPQSFNLYEYVGNNPITGIDADGHQFGPIYNHGETQDEACDEGATSQCGDTAGAAAASAERQAQQNEQAQQSGGVRNVPAFGKDTARAFMGAEGATDLFVGAGKIGGAIALGSNSELAGPLAPVVALGASYEGISGAVQMVQGTVLLAGAATGHTQEARSTSEFLGAVSTISGFTTLLVTSDVPVAAHVSSFEGIFTGAATRSIFDTMHDFTDAVINGKDLVTAEPKSSCNADVCTGIGGSNP